MKVCRAPYGLTIPLPDDVAERLGMPEGDEVEIVRVDKRPALPQAEIEKLFEEIRQLGGRLPAGYKFKRSDAYEDAEY